MNKKKLIIVCLSSLLFATAWLYYTKINFRLVSINPRDGKTTSDTISIKFNKNISNNNEILNGYKIEPYTETIMVINDNIIQIRPTDSFLSDTLYVVTLPSVQSGNKILDNLDIKFRTGSEVVDNYASTEDLYRDKNLQKYTFMNNSTDLVKDEFSIAMVGVSTENPTFYVNLMPVLDGNLTEFQINSKYITAFTAFEIYINGFGFQKEDLNIIVLPKYIQTVVMPINSNTSGD